MIVPRFKLDNCDWVHDSNLGPTLGSLIQTRDHLGLGSN